MPLSEVMKKPSEYRTNAHKCRQLASRMDRHDHRELLLKMAEQWEELARDRASLLLSHPESGRDGD